MDAVPKAAYNPRPSFMANGPGIVLQESGMELEEAVIQDIDDPDSVSLLDPDQTRYRPLCL
jgi:hypothetical protein